IPDSGIPRIRPVRILDVVARAKPGVTRAQVEAEMARITAHLAQVYPDDQAWGGATVVPLAETITGDVKSALLVVCGAVVFVLAMGVGTVGSLQFARVSSQASETAVALALGASRGRVLRQMLLESTLLAATGGLLGILIAAGAVTAVVAMASGQLPRASGIRL